MANRLGTFPTFSNLSPPWSLPTLDSNFVSVNTFANDSSLGYVNGIATDSGTVNAYQVTCPFGAPSAYNPGMTVAFVPANTNTGSSTIQVSPLSGTTPILDQFGNALLGGAIVAGRVTYLTLIGTAFRIINSFQTGGTPYYYDYDDLIVGNAQPNLALTAVFNSTKLLCGWQGGGAATSSPYTGAPFAGKQGVWDLRSTGGWCVLGLAGPNDSPASSTSGVVLDASTIVTLRGQFYLQHFSSNNFDITFGLWSNHQHAVGSANPFVGFFGNSTVSTNWQAYSNTSAVAITQVSTGVAATIGNWYDFTLTYNPTVPNVTFYIAGGLVATITTNIPVSPTNLYAGYQVFSNAGANASEILPDTFEMYVNPGVAKRFLYGPV